MCTVQAVAYQWLGRWYEDVDLDYQKAQHCYERAIQIDDDDIIAGKIAPPRTPIVFPLNPFLPSPPVWLLMSHMAPLGAHLRLCALSPQCSMTLQDIIASFACLCRQTDRQTVALSSADSLLTS